MRRVASAPRQVPPTDAETVTPFSRLVEGSRFVPWAWTHFFSPSALPLFRTKVAGERVNRLLRRDVLILAFLLAAVCACAAWPGRTGWKPVPR